MVFSVLYLGVVLERVRLDLTNNKPKENTQSFVANFALTLTPHSSSSVLPNGPPGDNHWAVEFFGSATNPPENWAAKTTATIPPLELQKGIPGMIFFVSIFFFFCPCC